MTNDRRVAPKRTGYFTKRRREIAFLNSAESRHQRKKWMTARSGFSEAQLADATAKIEYAVDKIEAQLVRTPWLAGATYTLADINFYSHCGMMVERMFPAMDIAKRAPRLVEWRDRVTARPAMAQALAMPDHTQPGLRTWSGHVQ